MNKHLRRIFLLLITFALCTRVASAQTTFASEEELKKQAAKLFYDNEFEEAYPLYTQLTSIYPKDPNYNYRLGVCMLYASDDKEKPIPFLEFASKRPEVEKEVFFYLARAYHLNYRFDDAIKEYQVYKGLASAAKAEKLMVDRQIEMCNNGKKLLNNLTDLLVIEKKEMSKTDFFRSYDISDIGGKLLVKPDEEAFKTALDKKKKEKSIIYLTSNNNQVFFSSYGEDANQGKDIFTVRKLPTGEWSKPQALGSPVNTKYDEDFPFLHPNGKVLYFCSKGHNSMGGYDIFKTTFNEKTNTWNKPVNIDFPVNTPDDDILYVTNENETEAYFSSARGSNTGKTVVYHIKVERKPIDIAIIKGMVVKNREGQALDVKITVKDFNNNEILGIFNSNAANGVYLINIQNGGKFLFTVEATGFLTQSNVVDVPVQYDFKPMKQEISYEAGTDKLIIKNMFDQEVDESSYLLALNFIKEKSKMEVNTSEQAITNASPNKDSIIDSSKQTTLAVDKTKVAPNSKLTNDDIVKIAYADAEDVEKEAEDIKEQADVALALANQKNELAQNKAKEAAQLLSDASKMDDAIKKQTTIEEANAASADADELNQETVAAFNLAKKLDFRAAAKQQEADLSKQYAKDLEAAVKSKNPTAALTRLDEQQKKLDELSEQNNNPTFVNSLKMDADNKKKALDKAIQTSADIKQEISDNEKLIASTQSDADKESNEKVKQGLLDQIAGLKKDTEDSKSEFALNEIKVNQLQKDYNGIINENELVGNVLDKAKEGSSETAAAIAATVDKSKLEQDVNSLNNSTVVASVKTKDQAIDRTNPSVVNPINDNASKTNGVVVKNENSMTDNSVKTNVINENKTSDNSFLINSIKDNSATSEDYNKKFENELVAAENITDEKVREYKKVELYNAWSVSINDELVSKKLEIKSEKVNSNKKKLIQEIASLEKDLKEKKGLSDQCIAKVEKIKNDSAAATNVKDNSIVNATKTKDAIENNSNPTIDNTLKESSKPSELSNLEKLKVELASAEESKTELERENKKVDAYTKYLDSSINSLSQAKSDLKSEKDNRKKKELTATIKSLEADIKEKQTELDRSIANVKSMQPAITSDKSSDHRNDNFANPNTSRSATIISKKQFLYASTIASELAMKSDVLNNEYELLTTQAKELRNKAGSEKNINDKNDQLAKAAGLIRQAEVKKIESAQLMGTANKSEYEKNQNTLTQLSAGSEANRADDILMAEMLKDETKIYFEKAQKSRELASTINSFSEKQSALDDAYKNEMIALEKQQKAIAIYKKYNPNFVEYDVVSVDPKTKKSIKTADNIAVVNKTDTVINTTKSSVTNNVVNTNALVKPDNVISSQKNAGITNDFVKINKTLTLSSNETFITLSKPVYSAIKPIPVNEKLPEGLIFKVQIGAFRNPIPQDLFKGMSPITGETTSQGFTRYTAGLFTKYESADKAKAVIKDLGYKDAFVVAFLNGKRISNTEALKMLGQPMSITKQATPSDVIENVTVLNPAITEQQSTVKTTTIKRGANSSEMAQAQNVSAVSGLFYTIQVGVYSQPVERYKLFNIQPLYSETAPNGNLRYYSGIYNTIPLASKAKKMIIDIGIKDAFVVAYYNGKRISMNEASRLEMQGPSVFSRAANLNSLPTFNGSDSNENKNTGEDIPKNSNESWLSSALPESNPKVETVVDTPLKETEKSEIVTNTVAKVIPMIIDSGIVFKVQIGAFKDEVPLEIANKFLKIAKKGIRNYTEANGLTIYSVGTYRTYEEASASKTEVVSEAGIVDAFIVAFKDGVKISVEEAKTSLNK